MNKLVLNNHAQDKKIVTFTINKEIKQRLSDVLISSDKYNIKQKSLWVNEAILLLRSYPDYLSIICNAEGNNNDFVLDKIYMTFKERCFFAEIRSDVVKEYPNIKGPQAAIIRAAILSRLMRRT